MQRFGSDQSNNGHVADIVDRSKLALTVTALRRTIISLLVQQRTLIGTGTECIGRERPESECRLPGPPILFKPLASSTSEEYNNAAAFRCGEQ